MSTTDRLASEFARHRRQWIPGRRIAQLGGYGGFRGRISDLRKRGWGIACEVRSIRRRDGSYALVSFYKLTAKGS